MGEKRRAEKEREKRRAVKRVRRRAPERFARLTSCPATTSSGGGSSSKNTNTTPTTVVGTSRNLEKCYLRLTTAPDPASVRPQPVLEAALRHVLRRRDEDDGDGSCCTYRGYVCEQLKSIRQDVVVQRLRNTFAVAVYLAHMRVALEEGDLGEANQCLTQLLVLNDEDENSMGTARGSGGSGPCDGRLVSAALLDECTAYALLHALYNRNALGMRAVLLARLHRDSRRYRDDDPDDERGPCVFPHRPATAHALAVVRAWHGGNFHAFFALYRRAPNHSAYLLDFLVERMRLRAYRMLVCAYRPTLPLAFVRRELAFANDTECRRFLVSKLRAVLVAPASPSAPTTVAVEAEEAMLDCTASKIALLQQQRHACT